MVMGTNDERLGGCPSSDWFCCERTNIEYRWEVSSRGFARRFATPAYQSHHFEAFHRGRMPLLPPSSLAAACGSSESVPDKKRVRGRVHALASS